MNKLRLTLLNLATIFSLGLIGIVIGMLSGPVLAADPPVVVFDTDLALPAMPPGDGTGTPVCIGLPSGLLVAGCDAAGDITAVTAGTGLTGGGVSGSVSLSADTAYLQRRVSGACAVGDAMAEIGSTGAIKCRTMPPGDIIGVTAGTGLAGGGTSGTATVSHADTSKQGSINNSNGTVIQDVGVDWAGHVTSLASANLDTRYVNATGDTMTGKLAISRIVTGTTKEEGANIDIDKTADAGVLYGLNTTARRVASSGSGTTYGAYFRGWNYDADNTSDSYGVKGYGYSGSNSDNDVYGVHGYAQGNSTSVRYGIYGDGGGTVGKSYGVYGTNADVGVYGSGVVTGVSGIATGTGVRVGVMGDGDGIAGTSYGVLARNADVGVRAEGTTYAVYAEGWVYVSNLGYIGTSNYLCSLSATSGIIGRCGSSLRAYKRDISNLEGALDIVLNLRPVTFNWKEDGRADFGLIAEEVAEVFPLLSSYDEEGKLAGVNYPQMGSLNTRAIQEIYEIVRQDRDALLSHDQDQSARDEAQNVAIDAQNMAINTLQTLNKKLVDQNLALEQQVHELQLQNQRIEELVMLMVAERVDQVAVQ